MMMMMLMFKIQCIVSGILDRENHEKVPGEHGECLEIEKISSPLT